MCNLDHLPSNQVLFSLNNTEAYFLLYTSCKSVVFSLPPKFNLNLIYIGMLSEPFFVNPLIFLCCYCFKIPVCETCTPYCILLNFYLCMQMVNKNLVSSLET